jgi:release factor glutamine methyltransferase
MKLITASSQKIRALVREGESVLAVGPHPERARRDAESLFLHLLKGNNAERNTAWLIAHWDNPASHSDEFRALIQRRLAGEPIQYIIGETEFYRMPFVVTPDVLIPRPETEHLVEKVAGLACAFHKPRLVDVGTGSGAIAIAFAHDWSHAVVTAIDASEAALDVAHRNAERLGFADQIRFLHGDLLAPVAHEQFDIVVSNPPYVPEADRLTLAVEVRDHEPGLALFAGTDGLDIYRRLIPQAFPCLAASGFIALEIGYGQSSAIADLLGAAGFQNIEFTPDLQGIPRVAMAQRP